MNIIDLFGHGNENDYVIFQDESWCKKTNFFYHGFLFVQRINGRLILNELKNTKSKFNKINHEISFKYISNSSKGKNASNTTKVALEWLEKVKRYLESGSVRFYLFGVDQNNTKNFWNNLYSYQGNTYIRFFEIGLKSAIRWFGTDKRHPWKMSISHIFPEKGPYEDERINKVNWLKTEFSIKDTGQIITANRTECLSSNEKESGNDFSIFLQLVDIMIGICRVSFCGLSKNKSGRRECLDFFIDIIERFNCERSTNPNSRYFKKFCICFFPSTNNVSKEEFYEPKIENINKRGQFYFERPTYRQKISKQQMNLGI